MLGRLRYRSWSSPSRAASAPPRRGSARRACAGSPRRGGRPCAGRRRAAPRSRRCAGPSASSSSTSSSPRRRAAAAFAVVDASRPAGDAADAALAQPPRDHRAAGRAPSRCSSARDCAQCLLVVRLGERQRRLVRAVRARHASAAPRQSPPSWSVHGPVTAAGTTSSIPFFRRQYASSPTHRDAGVSCSFAIRPPSRREHRRGAARATPPRHARRRVTLPARVLAAETIRSASARRRSVLGIAAAGPHEREDEQCLETRFGGVTDLGEDHVRRRGRIRPRATVELEPNAQGEKRQSPEIELEAVEYASPASTQRAADSCEPRAAEPSARLCMAFAASCESRSSRASSSVRSSQRDSPGGTARRSRARSRHRCTSRGRRTDARAPTSARPRQSRSCHLRGTPRSAPSPPSRRRGARFPVARRARRDWVADPPPRRGGLDT